MNEFKINSYPVSRSLTVRIVNAAGQFWHVASETFETFGAGGHAASSYDVNFSAKGGGVYRADWPTAIVTDGDYLCPIYDSAITAQAIAEKQIHVHNGIVTELTDLVESVDASGTGFYTWPYTLTRRDTGAPIAGASVWVTTDAAGTRIVASGVTSTSGVVTFFLDSGTYYVWRAFSGYTFTNPETFTVPTALSGAGTGSIITVGAAGPITRQSILDFLNKAYHENVLLAGTTFDVAIQMALDDITSKIEVLRDTYAAALVSGDYTINHPSDLMPGGLISITLTDAGGYAYDPLTPFPRGLRDYRQAIRQNNTVGRPIAYVEGEDAKWYLWRPADGAYDVLVEYYKLHAQDVTTIALPGVCALALKTGAAYFEATLRRNPQYQATWTPQYSRAFKDLRAMYPGEPRGVYP